MNSEAISPFADRFAISSPSHKKKLQFYYSILAVIREPFNIFGFDFRKPNLSKIIREQKLRSRAIGHIGGFVFLLLLSLNLNAQENRSLSGYGNNLINKDWGAAHEQVPRVTTTNYKDGISEINDENLPDPRVISNKLFDQEDLISDGFNLSDYVWVFGQFIDHDITLVESDPAETILLRVPQDDAFFTPNDFIITSRNKALEGSGTSRDNPRQFVNEISSYIDGSAVYGVDESRASWLRTFEDGKLKTSNGDLLPWNTLDGEFDSQLDFTAPFMADDTRMLTKYFVAGDLRANENPLLIAMHTIFVREHNRLCDEIKFERPHWSDEQIYQRARKLVGAFIQNVVYKEWLPSMGVNLPEYRSYSEEMNASIYNVFSAAAFRIGHTLINSNLIRMNNEGEEIIEGSITLQDAFFNPFAVLHAGGIDPYFKGMGTQVMQKMDCKVIDDLRNFLFGAPGAGGLDLASINIFRGRDRGLSDYNTLRGDFGLPFVDDFSEFSASPEDAAALEDLYGDINNIDPWVGMLAERNLPNSIFGDLVMRIMEDQFQVLRDGDRFYFENDPAFTLRERNEIKSTSLHDIIMRNTEISLMQKNLFYAMPHSDIPDGPEIIAEPLSAVLFPNPAFDRTTLKIFSDIEKTVTVKFFDSNGKLMKLKEYDLLEGNNFVELNIQQYWPRGLYNVLIEYEDQYSICKLIKE